MIGPAAPSPKRGMMISEVSDFPFGNRVTCLLKISGILQDTLIMFIENSDRGHRSSLAECLMTTKWNAPGPWKICELEGTL